MRKVNKRTSCLGKETGGRKKMKQGTASWMNLLRSRGRGHMYMCVYMMRVSELCVCLYVLTGESLQHLCSDGQRRARRQSFSPTVFIYKTYFLLTNLLSS